MSTEKLSTLDKLSGLGELGREILVILMGGMFHLLETKNIQEIEREDALLADLLNRVGKEPTEKLFEKLEKEFPVV